MHRTVWKSALGLGLVLMAIPSDVLAGGRGGGYGGRGGYGGGERGGYGGESSHSPSMSQPRSSSGESRSPYGSQSRDGSNPYASREGGTNPYANKNSGSQGGSNPYANKNNNNNNSTLPNNGANAGTAYNDRNKNNSTLPNNGAGAAGAAYANKNNENKSGLPNNGAGAVGAAAGNAYGRNNKSGLPNNGAGAVGAAAGAGYANRNNGYGYGGGAAAIGAGYWNGNNSAWGGGYGFGNGIGAWGTGGGAYAWGYSNYSNPYYGGGNGVNNNNLPVADNGNAPQSTGNYSQPIATIAPDPAPAAVDQANAAFSQARDAFKSGQYAQAQQLVNQALAETPNDSTLHQFFALTLIAQGQYEKAAAPIYAVLSVGPGWNWTTLSGMYPDVATFTTQLRGLEQYVDTNPGSSAARFVLGYVYLCEGQDGTAVKQFKAAAQLQPSDTLSAQLIAQYQPAGAPQPAPVPPTPDAAPGLQGKLPGQWTAQPAAGAKVALTVQDDGSFTWTVSGPGKPATTIAGTSTLSDGMLTLAPSAGQNGPLAGKITWQDADHFTFKLPGGPATDPGLKFAR